MSAKKAFLIRIDQRVFDALEKWAADDLRSVNAQIEFILTDSVRKKDRLGERKIPEGETEGPDQTDT
jgi:hypothetical protein